MFRTDIVTCATGDSEMQRIFSSPVICPSPNTVRPDGCSFVTLTLVLISHCLASQCAQGHATSKQSFLTEREGFSFWPQSHAMARQIQPRSTVKK